MSLYIYKTYYLKVPQKYYISMNTVFYPKLLINVYLTVFLYIFINDIHFINTEIMLA